MCSYTIAFRYSAARMVVRSRVPLSSVIAVSRANYEPLKLRSRRPASPCDIIARSGYEPLKQSSDLYQIALVDGDGSILLDDLGNIIIIGYCYA